jgi:hypothetical protein
MQGKATQGVSDISEIGRIYLQPYTPWISDGKSFREFPLLLKGKKLIFKKMSGMGAWSIAKKGLNPRWQWNRGES